MGRYFSPPPKDTVYPPEVHDYNDRFTELLQNIKKRHDPTVTTVAQGVLEWKRKRGAGRIDQSIQEWLDRFYMSRIGIRFLIGQRKSRLLTPKPCDLIPNLLFSDRFCLLPSVMSDVGELMWRRCRFKHSTTTQRLRRNHLYKSRKSHPTTQSVRYTERSTTSRDIIASQMLT